VQTTTFIRWALHRCMHDVARGDLQSALANANVAVRADAGNALAYALRANVRSLRGDDAGALNDAGYAIELNPVLPEGYFYRARANARTGLWKDAADDLRALVFLDANFKDGMGRHDLGMALLALEDYQAAIINFTRAIGASKSSAQSYFYRSFAYEAEGAIDSAISDLNATIQRDPAFAGAHFRRALLFLRKGNETQARIDLRRAQELDPRNSAIAAAQSRLDGQH
jgi:tetratricopeptide (TPR) repeat protein